MFTLLLYAVEKLCVLLQQCFLTQGWSVLHSFCTKTIHVSSCLHKQWPWNNSYHTLYADKILLEEHCLSIFLQCEISGPRMLVILNHTHAGPVYSDQWRTQMAFSQHLSHTEQLMLQVWVWPGSCGGFLHGSLGHRKTFYTEAWAAWAWCKKRLSGGWLTVGKQCWGAASASHCFR